MQFLDRGALDALFDALRADGRAILGPTVLDGAIRLAPIDGASCFTCPTDCGPCPPPACGDGDCRPDQTETCLSCPADCGPCPGACGDGVCSAAQGETCVSCPADCGACSFCGDGLCDPRQMETCESCALDCGPCPGSCGDGLCDAMLGEDCMRCPRDCGPCPGGCGDGTCSTLMGESCFACPADCGPCGVASCSETLFRAVGCSMDDPLCFGNCLARACMSAQSLLLESFGCVASSGCGSNITCLLSACPGLFSCLFHTC